MNDELKKFSQTVLAATRGADTSAGVSNPIVNDFARSAFTDNLTSATNGIGGLASEAAAQEKAAADAARRAQIEKLQAMNDPSKYQKVRKQDGGFDFLDPDGNKIDITRYAQVTGQRASSILSDSDNPFDQQYVNDYSNTKNLIDAINNGDTDTINGFKANNASIGAMKPEDLMRELIRKYPHIYGNGKYADSTRNANNPLLRYADQTGAIPGATSSGGAGTRNWQQ